MKRLRIFGLHRAEIDLQGFVSLLSFNEQTWRALHRTFGTHNLTRLSEQAGSATRGSQDGTGHAAGDIFDRAGPVRSSGACCVTRQYPAAGAC